MEGAVGDGVPGAELLGVEELRQRALEAAVRRETSLPGISAEKAAELKERRLKEELLGKLAEYYTRKKMELPMGLNAATVEQLRRHWERTQQPAKPESEPPQEDGHDLRSVACGALAADHVDGGPAPELDGEVFGARCVDARRVEHSVIDRCDTHVELQRTRAELAHALREEARLRGCQRVAAGRRRAAPGAVAGAAAEEIQEAGGGEGQPAPIAGEGNSEAEDSGGPAAELALARARRERLQATVRQLEQRSRAQQGSDLAELAAQTGASEEALEGEAAGHHTAASSSTGPLPTAGSWGQLKSGSLDFDEDSGSEAERVEQGSSKEESASQRPPHLPLKRVATMSAKEYLSKFQARNAAVAAAAAAKAATPATSSASRHVSAKGKSSSVASPATKKRPPQEAEPAKGVAESPVPKPRLEDAKKLLAAQREEVQQRAQPTAEATRGYKIDVNQLMPKAAVHDMNKWKAANPAEWRALQSEGEAVSPAVNLVKPRPGVKRTSEGQDEEKALKVRRDDDTDENAFRRRQGLWTKGDCVHPVALSAKQEVDEAGRPKRERVKSELGSDDEEKVKKRVLERSTVQDDVHVTEGLRSPRWLWEALYPYQHKCVRWLWELHCEKMGGILADEMGLGKTVQIAAYLGVLHHSGVLQNIRIQNTSLGMAAPVTTGGVLIVCPATLISQWRNELHIWYPPLRVCIMHQVGEQERKEAVRVAASQQAVLITSYETMRVAHEDLLRTTWVMVILDEGQKIRNPHANVTIAAKQFSTPHRIILSGSPIQNNLQELWSLFDFICPGRLGTLPVFLEEFAQPIENGNVTGANEARVAAAYQCALALRELTQPCILRRTKAECMDVLKLPHKQEQVLFCHLTPEQYQVYIDFLQSDQVRRAMTVAADRKAVGSVFFSISVLRKLCNHPDLLLLHADPSLHPPDIWNFARSGKMKVLAEIMKKWKREGHRALVFVQTIQMLEVLQRWMNGEGYTHLRIDGKTAVKRRLKMIEEFNGNVDLFCMVLTTRVGGVGLNIIGADRVVIFDPDWNPMTDVQARERTWRIGQKRDVTVYRLVLSGTVEEKIYQRQVYKHFLSQKILNDPRQRQFFKWNDLADLFEVPPMPPGFSAKDMLELKEKYKALFKKLKTFDDLGENEVETTEVMKSITELPTKEAHKATKESKLEHSAILQTLYDSNGIKASFNHDKVEQPLLDRKIIRDGANMIATRALAALQRSSRERSSHHISEPTWTGKRGRAGAGAVVKREPKTEFKSEMGFSSAASSTGLGAKAWGSAPSAHILEGLKQLAAIRASVRERNLSQSDEAAKLGIVRAAAQGGASQEPGAALVSLPALEGDCVGLPIELHKSDRLIAETILGAFLNPKLAGKGHCLTTGQVLEHLASGIAAHHTDLFKSLLKQMCDLTKPTHPSQPGVWTLRPDFWPGASGRAGG